MHYHTSDIDELYIIFKTYFCKLADTVNPNVDTGSKHLKRLFIFRKFIVNCITSIETRKFQSRGVFTTHDYTIDWRKQKDGFWLFYLDIKCQHLEKKAELVSLEHSNYSFETVQCCLNLIVYTLHVQNGNE